MGEGYQYLRHGTKNPEVLQMPDGNTTEHQCKKPFEVAEVNLQKTIIITGTVREDNGIRP